MADVKTRKLPDWVIEARRLREHLQAKHGQLSDSTPGIVQDRQERS